MEQEKNKPVLEENSPKEIVTDAPVLEASTEESPEREVDLDSLIQAPASGQTGVGPSGLIKRKTLGRAVRARARFRRVVAKLAGTYAPADKEFDAVLKRYDSDSEKEDRQMNHHMTRFPHVAKKPSVFLIKLKLAALSKEPFSIVANCTKFVQDASDIRLELILDTDNLKKLVGNYNKRRSTWLGGMAYHLLLTEIEILDLRNKNPNKKRAWLLKGSKQRKCRFDVNNITTEMIENSKFKVCLRCNSV